MDIHIIIFQNIFEYSQSPWYRVSETPPDLEFRSNLTWENLISVKKFSDFLQSSHVKIIFFTEILNSKVKYYLNSKSGGVSETQ